MITHVCVGCVFVSAVKHMCVHLSHTFESHSNSKYINDEMATPDKIRNEIVQNRYVPHAHLYFWLSPSRDYDSPSRKQPGNANDAPAEPLPHYYPVDSTAMCRPISNLDHWTRDLPYSTRKTTNKINDSIKTKASSNTHSDLFEDIGRFGQKFLHDIFVNGRYLH